MLLFVGFLVMWDLQAMIKLILLPRLLWTPPKRWYIPCNSLILECVLKKHVRVQWQALYDNETKGLHYKAIAPVFGQNPLAQFPSRIKLVTINTNRLQFGHCLLRFSRFTVDQADDGLCSTCSVPETIHHFLLQCPVFDLLRSTFLDTLTSLGISSNSDWHSLEPLLLWCPVFSFISASGRKI